MKKKDPLDDAIDSVSSWYGMSYEELQRADLEFNQDLIVLATIGTLAWVGIIVFVCKLCGYLLWL